MWWTASTAAMAIGRRAAAVPIRQKSSPRETLIWNHVFPGWMRSEKQRFDDILVSTLFPDAKGTRKLSIQGQIETTRPGGETSAGFFYAVVCLVSWISCRLHTRIGSRSFAATASAAARAPLIVVTHGTRYVTTLRRMAFSSKKAGAPVVV